MVFHCAAGKDRTGLVAALLLAALGVSEADILDDYELTNRVPVGLAHRPAPPGAGRPRASTSTS